MQNLMDRNRRRMLLVDKLEIFRQDLDKREKMRIGLQKMWEGMYNLNETYSCILRQTDRWRQCGIQTGVKR